ncbi:hypothetical protein LFM09_02800 [Lentzea alba]|uniref:hypothetical protein n=1 Tax=Lentzea alba TaxID=2714351 RepID=UPI0039BFC865
MNAAIRWGWIGVVLVFVAAGVIFAFRATDTADTTDASSTAAPSTAASPTAFVDPNPDQPTKSEIVVAVEGGRPAAGYTVEEAGQASSCYRRKDGQEDGLASCSAGVDVCWAGPEPTTLLCGLKAWEKKLARRVADGPIKEIDASGYEPPPWGLELANGAKCVRRTGGSWGGRADGLIGAYSCEGASGIVLDGDDPLLDQSKPAWTVKVGPLGDDPTTVFPPPEKIRVVTAYFAKSSA